MSEYEVPKRVSADGLKNIIKGYYLEGAHNEPVKTKGVEKTTDMGDRVGRQTKFLNEIGIVNKSAGNRGERKLTKEGESIAEALMGGNNTLAQSLMRDLLEGWEFTEKITGFIDMNEGSISENELIEYMSANATSTNKTGHRALIDLLVWSNILTEEDGKYLVKETKESEEAEEADEGGEDDTNQEEAKTEHAGQDVIVEPTDEVGSLDAGGKVVNIEFSFNADDSPENIEEVILAARRALNKELTSED